MHPANHSLNPDASPAALLATREWLSVGLFAVMLFIAMFGSINFLIGFLTRFTYTTRPGLGPEIETYLVAAVLAAGPFGVAFGLIAMRRAVAVALVAALPPTLATVALDMWETGWASTWWLLQIRNAVFFLIFVATAWLVHHFATGITPKKRVTIGVVLFAGLSVASLIAVVFIFLLEISFGDAHPLFLWPCFIASVVAAVFAFALWRETRKGRVVLD
jgi:hypothetical protein